MDQSLAGAKLPKGTEGSPDLDADCEQLSLLEETSSLEFGKLESAFRTKSFENQELLCHCTDTFHDSFLILEGVVSVVRKRGHDLHVERIERQGAVFLLGPLDGLGEGQSTYRALGKVKVLAMGKQMMAHLLETDPVLCYKLVLKLYRLAAEKPRRL